MPRDANQAGSTSAGNPGCFWSRLTATTSNFTGALRASAASMCTITCESLPPDTHAITRSPSSIMR